MRDFLRCHDRWERLITAVNFHIGGPGSPWPWAVNIPTLWVNTESLWYIRVYTLPSLYSFSIEHGLTVLLVFGMLPLVPPPLDQDLLAFLEGTYSPPHCNSCLLLLLYRSKIVSLPLTELQPNSSPFLAMGPPIVSLFSWSNINSNNTSLLSLPLF